MTLSTLFRSPFVRVAFLAFAVFSTVATSEAQWSLDAVPFDEDVTIFSRHTLEKKIQYDASRPVSLHVELGGEAHEGSRLRFELDGGPVRDRGIDDAGGATDGSLSGPDASATADAGKGPACEDGCCEGSCYVWSGDRWHTVTSNGTLSTEYYRVTTIEWRPMLDKSGTVTVRITNESSDGLKLHLRIRAEIGAYGRDSVPDGAFVNAKVVP